MWVIVAGIDDPVITQTYTTSVTLENVNYLTENGKYSELLGGNNTVTFSVSAKRSYHERLSNSDFTAVADIERIEDIGEDGICRVPITITCTKFSSSNVEISSRQLYLELAVEDLGNVQKRISVATEGTVMDGCALGNVEIVTSNLLKISGPSSVTSQIDTVVATINVDGMSSDVTDTVVPVLYDADGNEITSSRITKSVSTSNVSISILQTKEIPVTASASGEPAAGYAATGEVTCAPDRITVAGRSSALASLEEIVIPAEELDLTGATEDVVELIDIRQYLPDGVSLTNTSEDGFNGRVAVTAGVEPLVDVTGQMDQSRIQILNVPDGYQVTLAPGEAVSIRLRGLQDNLDTVNVSQLSGSIDVAEWMQENNLSELTEGNVEMEVTVSLPDHVTQVGTVTAVVNVMADITADNGTAGEAAAAGAVESGTEASITANS